jgi:hypothetical protein
MAVQTSLETVAKLIAARVWGELFSIDVPQEKCNAMKKVVEQIVKEQLKGRKILG